MNTLDALSEHSILVADTGDLDAIARLRPKDATTNPSLVTNALLSGEHDALVARIKALGLSTDAIIDRLGCELGALILTLIPGRVSTEVDARLSYDADATYIKALELIDCYDALAVDTRRVLIKIAATWQGIRAAERLERAGIACNLTLLFTDAQARACADAGVTLISPFVGRITDFQKAQAQQSHIDIHDDMGVNSVKRIYDFYKKHGYDTQIMGASFRTVEQILALSGCDLLTISPALLDVLAGMDAPAPRHLSPPKTQAQKPTPISQAQFAACDNVLNALLVKGIEGFIQARESLAQALHQPA